jgi:hypothetical protein
MLILHAAQKILNTSRIKPVLYVSEPSEGQLLHSWYVRLLATGFPGKLLTMYVNEPSLMTIICKGRTIQGTWPEFVERLNKLLNRLRFPEAFCEKEKAGMDGYIVSKTNSKAILAFMNNMVPTLEHHSFHSGNYDHIPQDWLEDLMMEYLHGGSYSKKNFSSPVKYWENILQVGLNRRKII